MMSFNLILMPHFDLNEGVSKAIDKNPNKLRRLFDSCLIPFLPQLNSLAFVPRLQWNLNLVNLSAS